MNNIELIKSGPTNGPEILDFQDEIAESVENGFEDPLNLFIRLKALSNAIDGAMSKIQSAALEEAQKHGQKSFGYLNAKIEIREMGTKWFFDKTGDPIIYRIEATKKEISEKEKDRQAFLKTLKEKTTFLDEETGEVFEVYPARKESKTGLALSFI
jgi:hypothetical protein